MNRLLEKSIGYKNATEDALKLASESFANATKMLQVLSDFDQYFKDNKIRAEKAQNLESETKSNIDESKKLVEKMTEKLAESRSVIGKLAVDTNVNKASLDRENKV